MSRSYKKTPIVKYTYEISRKTAKKYASRKIRVYDGDLSNGSFYKKIEKRCEIYEISTRKTLEEYIKLCEYRDQEIIKELWCRRYYRK